jgi:hypothetical protein
MSFTVEHNLRASKKSDAGVDHYPSRLERAGGMCLKIDIPAVS